MRNLAHRRCAFFERLWVDNPGFDSGKRRSDRAKDNALPGRIEEGAAGGFGQAVGVQNVDAERVKIAGDGGIEARTSGHQIAHASAEGGVNLSEEKFAGVDSEPPQPAVERHQRAHQPQREFAAFVQFLENALVNQVEELGHHGKRGDVAFLQGAQQFGGVQRLQVDDARAIEQRQEKIRHLREDMKHRENSQQRIRRADLHGGEHRIRFADEVGVGEHDALRIGGGARSVEQRRQVALGGDDGLKAGGAGGEDGIEIGGEAL